MIHFEIEGQAYAVDAAELSGVATSCPLVSYPGLPAGVAGIIQWSGRIFPIVDLFAAGGELGGGTYLFSAEGLMGGELSEVAVAVPGKVRVFFPVSTEGAPAGAPAHVTALVRDREGESALKVSFKEVAKALRAKAAAKRGGGRGDQVAA
jgi:hypothetical protein